METERHEGKCVSCGLTGFIDDKGYCEECTRKMEEAKIKKEQREKEEIAKIDRIRYDKEKFENEGTTCAVSKDGLIRAFNHFYKFFHTGSIVTSVSIVVVWFFYWLVGSADYTSNQAIYVQGSFNPHVEALAYAALILILGLFLSYISAAICRWIEHMK